MADRPAIDRWDVAAVASAVAVLLVAYVVAPGPIVQYGAWLTVFCIWMFWFVFFGTKWLYGVDV
jgi:hypothetical protein